MIMNFTECVNHASFFEDFVKYKTIDKYIAAVLKFYETKNYEDSPKFVPMYLDVKLGLDSCFSFVKGGEVEKDAKKNLRLLKSFVPASERHFMSDYLCIEGDGFEHELCFSWRMCGRYIASPIGFSPIEVGSNIYGFAIDEYLEKNSTVDICEVSSIKILKNNNIQYLDENDTVICDFNSLAQKESFNGLRVFISKQDAENELAAAKDELFGSAESDSSSL